MTYYHWFDSDTILYIFRLKPCPKRLTSSHSLLMPKILAVINFSTTNSGYKIFDFNQDEKYRGEVQKEVICSSSEVEA